MSNNESTTQKTDPHAFIKAYASIVETFKKGKAIAPTVTSINDHENISLTRDNKVLLTEIHSRFTEKISLRDKTHKLLEKINTFKSSAKTNTDTMAIVDKLITEIKALITDLNNQEVTAKHLEGRLEKAWGGALNECASLSLKIGYQNAVLGFITKSATTAAVNELKECLQDATPTIASTEENHHSPGNIQ